MVLGKGLYGLPEPEEPVRPPSRTRWLIRVPLIVFTMVGISLMTLSMIGGKSDSMKANLEGYLNDATGMESHIGILNGVHFFPAMGFDLEDLTLKSEEDTKVSIRKIRVSIPFWNIPLNRSEFRDFHVEGAVIEPGVILPRRIEIDQLMIDRLKSGEPLLVLNGRYGGEDVALRVDLKSRATSPSAIFVYSLADNATFEGHAGEMIFKGSLDRGRKRGADLHLDEIKVGDNLNGLKMTITASRMINGTMESGKSKAQFTINLDRKEKIWAIRGNIDAEQLDIEDIAGETGLIQSWQAMKRFYFGPDQNKNAQSEPYDLGRMDLSLEAKIKKLIRKGAEWGDVSGLVKIQNSHLDVDPLKGRLWGGDATGSIHFDTLHSPAHLEVSLGVRGVKGDVSSSSSAQADMTMNVTSEGGNADAMWANLHGTVDILARPGSLTGDLAKMWTGGILPDGTGALDCGAADFIIKGPVATAQTFILNSGDLAVAAEGTFDLRQGILALAPSASRPEKTLCTDHLKL